MGLLTGPAGVIAAYLACYVVHNASNPLHMGLRRSPGGGGGRWYQGRRTGRG